MSPESYFKETILEPGKQFENVFVYKYNLVKTKRNSIFYLFNDGRNCHLLILSRVSTLFQYMVI